MDAIAQLRQRHRIKLAYPLRYRRREGLVRGPSQYPEHIERCGAAGLDVFLASESLMREALALGGAGCISATANVNPRGIRLLYDGWQTAEAHVLHEKANAVRTIFQGIPIRALWHAGAAIRGGVV